MDDTDFDNGMNFLRRVRITATPDKAMHPRGMSKNNYSVSLDAGFGNSKHTIESGQHIPFITKQRSTRADYDNPYNTFN